MNISDSSQGTRSGNAGQRVEGLFRSLRARRTENVISEDEPQTTPTFNPGTGFDITEESAVPDVSTR